MALLLQPQLFLGLKGPRQPILCQTEGKGILIDGMSPACPTLTLDVIPLAPVCHHLLASLLSFPFCIFLPNGGEGTWLGVGVSFGLQKDLLGKLSWVSLTRNLSVPPRHVHRTVSRCLEQHRESLQSACCSFIPSAFIHSIKIYFRHICCGDRH